MSNFFQNDTDSLIKSLMDFIRESASGAPRGIRTPDLRIRSPSLYPSEPWAHYSIFYSPWRVYRSVIYNLDSITSVRPKNSAFYSPRVRLG